METVGKLDLSGLNRAQTEAVENLDGPSLIIAGAGSGKTRVLTYKIANLLAAGVAPGAILALTFTNKASKEMKERIAKLVGDDRAARLWMGTFHSIFIRILRKYSDLIGYPAAFTVYDTTDTRSALRQCIKELELDDKTYKPQEVASRISMAKNNLVTASAYKNNPAAIEKDRASKRGMICDIYERYAHKCRTAGAMDFDDILLNMNILLRDHPEVVDELSNRFTHILVDEYQDTNLAQYYIVRKLSAQRRNITVVGDDSQSIYGFRGARIQNIFGFKKDFPEAKEFRLEQNYRSSQTIVNAANSVIAKNRDRLPKQCFSKGDQGEKIEVIPAFTEQDEAMSVVNSITARIRSANASYDSFAILYRTNAQSRAVEEALRKRNLPYRIFAGHSFYERQEIKDTIAYFRIITNHNDDESLKRIINFPARGIGETTLSRLYQASRTWNISIWDTILRDGLSQFDIKDATVNKLRSFCQMISAFGQKAVEEDAYQVAVDLLNIAGVLQALRADTSIEGQGRVANVEELLNGINEFVEEQSKMAVESGAEDPVITLVDYLENVALMTDYEAADRKDDRNRVALMTAHSSKGLEFPYVYIIGMEEKMFPSSMCIDSEKDIEEERRLFYVALTRAEKAASVSFARSRMKWGERVKNPPSRFLYEIDQQYLSQPIKSAAGYGDTVDDDDFRPGQNTESGWRGGFFRYSPNGPLLGRKSSSPYGNNFSRSTSPHPAPNRFSGSGTHSGSFTPNRPTPNRPNPAPTFSRTIYQPSSDFRPDDPSRLAVGQRIEHERFGYGQVLSIEGSGPMMKVVVNFENCGEKTLLTKYAKMRIV